MDHNFNAKNVQELETMALQKELEVITVYNPFTTGFGNYDFPENPDELRHFEKDGTYNVILNNAILVSIPPKGKKQISAKYMYAATKYLVDRLIIEGESTSQVNIKTNQMETTNGFPLLNEDAYRRKYLAQVLGLEKPKAKKSPDVVDTEEESTPDQDGFEGLNEADRDTRKAELEEMETSELRVLVESLGAEPKDNRKRAYLIEAILDKEF